MVHAFLKFSCRLALHFFFRKWQTQSTTTLPVAPSIFLANHPNTFLDAILIACSTDRKIWFLARGEVFKSKWSAWILSKLGLIPIFRFRDGHESLRRNEDVIHRCATLLGNGDSLLLFPEGDNSTQGTLLPLQKGFIRIAEAALKMKPGLNLQIIPIGLQYSANKGFGGVAQVNVGSAVPYTSLAKDKTIEQILTTTWRLMNNLVASPVPSDPKQKSSWPAQLNRFYFAVNILSLKLFVRLAASLIKEEAMKNSVKFAGGMFLAWPVFFLQSILVWQISQSWPAGILYFASLPLTVRIYLNGNR
jgi:1-acyl-sn-glycerol-3-phosphate acyltransferase